MTLKGGLNVDHTMGLPTTAAAAAEAEAAAEAAAAAEEEEEKVLRMVAPLSGMNVIFVSLFHIASMAMVPSSPRIVIPYAWLPEGAESDMLEVMLAMTPLANVTRSIQPSTFITSVSSSITMLEAVTLVARPKKQARRASG